MYKINFNHLNYFLTIAQEGSIVKASKKLNITQPALSHQLKLLEEDLGKKLFDRIGKRLIINKDGEMVKEYARKIFRHSEEMIQLLKNDTQDFITIIKIGVTPWVSPNLVHRFIRPLMINPHIKVQVFQKDMEALHKEIVNNKLDLILSDSAYSGRSKKLIGHLLYKDQLLCVANSKIDNKTRFPKSIANKKVINFSESCEIGRLLNDYFEEKKLNLNIIGEFTDIALIHSSVKKDGVVTFLPKSVVTEDLKNKTLVKLGELKDLEYNLWAITKVDLGHESAIYQAIKKAPRA